MSSYRMAVFMILVFLLSSIPMFQFAPSHANQDTNTIALINGQVIDGTGAEPIPNGGVIITDAQIVFVGTMDEIELTDDMQVIDVGGRTILPGIFNAHAHRVANPLIRQIAWLKYGVTSVCDVGSTLEAMELLEQQIAPDGSPTTNAFQSGPIVTVPGGYPGSSAIGTQLNYEILSPLDAEDAVLDLKSRGADYIKIALNISEDTPLLSQAEVEALVAAAHENDMLVHAHILDSSVLGMAVEAGIDVIQHVPWSYLDMATTQYPAIEDFQSGKTDHIVLPPEFEADLLQAIEAGVILVPTLDVYTFRSVPDEYVEAFRQTGFDVVRFYYENGGLIGLGNDTGNQSVKSGMLLEEMLLLQEVGLEPFDILVAGTYHAALACGQADWVGTLQADMLADVIVVDGDPLADLNVMDEVVVIIKSGQLVDNSLPDGE